MYRNWAMADFAARLSATFTEQQEALKRFLLRRLGNAALAEDLAQETWIRAVNAKTAAPIGNPRAYLFRIAANLATDHRRHVGKGIEVEAAAERLDIADRAPSPEEAALYRSEVARLLKAVDRLPPRCREVFVLARFEEMTYAEIAGRLSISRNTVIKHMVAALAVLEREMRAEKNSAGPVIDPRSRPSQV
jgi:RNA polymerase sigma-70 factor (ECF subfamily)